MSDHIYCSICKSETLWDDDEGCLQCLSESGSDIDDLKEEIERLQSIASQNQKISDGWRDAHGKTMDKLEAEESKNKDLQAEVKRLKSMTHIMAGYISATDGRWQDKHPEECLKHFEELTEDTRRRQQQAERQEVEG